MRLGSVHRRDGERVVKQLTERHPAGRNFVAAMASSGEQGMRSYLAELDRVAVRLPGNLEIVSAEPLTVQHRWMDGPTLLDAPTMTPEVFASAIAEVATWVRRLDRRDARVDTNLANFCIVNGRPVLVDVLPPLVPSRRPRPTSLFDDLFLSLCFDTSVILDALCGYALRQAIRSGDRGVIADLLGVVNDLVSSPETTGLAKEWFRARLKLARRAARGVVDPEMMHEFFALTSVLKFRHFDEPGRRRRVDEVAIRIRELDL
ncbi:hypothetical protein GCM10011581_48440 [Saccharopolyspora subtropica]|uniref:Uncharacterized protein n=1 Tax=Saccharopolyspora thermophila TaxID=89367 RepID=A0A917NJR0_9PSEU|nr:hypothetical protein [Saccharopolyspora subtropica]GGJ05668.1 hypothetical protein GCM10011581_48440 [Saccharopolyspora subtropica]